MEPSGSSVSLVDAGVLSTTDAGEIDCSDGYVDSVERHW